MSQIPEEIIELILSYAPDFHDNLLSCHEEMLIDHRPIYYKKVVSGLHQELLIAPPGITLKKTTK